MSGFIQPKGSPWGLSRISNRQLGANKYVFDGSAGEGTCAYVIDTGVDASHPVLKAAGMLAGAER